MPSTNPCLRCSASPTNKTEIFNWPDYKKMIANKLRTFYKKNEFFDITLISQIDKCKVSAHQVVLTATSDFFYDQFRGPIKDYKEITLHDINGPTLKSIVEFMYMGSIELRMETVHSILKAALTFQINSLIEACWAFLRSNINVSNCLFITFLAEEYKNIELYVKGFAFVCEHFEMVCEEIQFVQLNESQLTRLISSDDINVRSETKVFLSVMAWTNYDKANRDKRMVHLLEHVRYEWLTAKFIIENMPLLCEGECCELVSSWLQWHVTPENRPQLSLRQNIPRKSYEKLCLATWRPKIGFEIQTFDQNSNSWAFETFVWQPKKPKDDYMAEALHGKLFICGGTIDGLITNLVEYLDIKTKQINNLRPMNDERRLPGIMVCNGQLFAVGGYDGDDEVLLSVEKYDFSKCKWEYSAPLPRRFECMRLAPSNGLLYVLGRDNTMLCYNPITDKWTEKACPVGKIRLIDVRGCLYALGGSGDDIQSYDPSKDVWKIAGSAKLAEDISTCTAFRNRLVFYGLEEEGVVLQKYNPETNKTTKLIEADVSDDVKWFCLFTM